MSLSMSRFTVMPWTVPAVWPFRPRPLCSLLLLLLLVVSIEGAQAQQEPSESPNGTVEPQTVSPDQLLQPFESLGIEPDGSGGVPQTLDSAIPQPNDVNLSDFFEQFDSVELGSLDSFDARQRARVPVGGGAPAGLRLRGTTRLRLGYDSNPQLLSPNQADGDTDAFEYDVEPSVTLSYRTRQLSVQSTARVSYNEVIVFDDDGGADLESFDQFAGLQLNYFRGLSTVNVFSNLANTTTRRGLVTDTGVVLNDNRFLSFGGGGSFSRRISSRLTVRAFVSSSRREVDSEELNDFTTTTVGTTVSRIMSSRDSVSGTVQYSVFSPDGALTSDTKTISLLAQWARQFSQRFSASLEAGPQFIDREAVGAIPASTRVGFFINAGSLIRTGERGEVQVNASRSVQPSSLGQVFTNSAVRLQYNRQFRRDLSIAAPLSFQLRETALSSNIDDRTFITFTPRVTWSPLERVGLVAQYEHRRENTDSLPLATSNAVFLQVRVNGETGL